MALMIEVNLLPAEFRVSRNEYAWVGDRRVVYSTLAFIILIAVGWMGWLTLEASLASTRSHIDALHKEIQSYDTVKTQIKKLEDLKAKQDAKNQSLRSISVSKKRWIRLLEDLNASVPPHTWIISIKEEGDDKIAIVGRTYVFQEVAQLMMQLERRPFFDVPALDNIEQVSVTADKSTTPAFAFTLHCPLNAAIHSDETPKDVTQKGAP
jgi:Tfp pilus assembly protein PilN